jgi:hypothetical protein
MTASAVLLVRVGVVLGAMAFWAVVVALVW